jgi:glycosyltransferase involved in cell wall biosynthesis
MPARLIGTCLQPFFDFACSPAISTLETAMFRIWLPWAPLPVGVDLAQFPVMVQKERRLPLTRFVYIGSLAKARCLDVMIAGFSAFARNAPQPVTLDIFGDGDDRARLESVAVLSKAAIRFYGSVQQVELSARLPSYHVGIGYVPTGPYMNSPSLKVLEYAAAGLPILASRTSAHEQWAREGIEIHFFKNTVESLAEKAAYISRKGVGRDTLLANRIFAERFDWHAIVNNILLPIYRNLLKR